MSGPDHTDTIRYRLTQVEASLRGVESKVDTLSTEVGKWEDRRAEDRLIPERIRKLEDDSLELRVYLKQAKWVAAGVIGAVVVGLVNLVLNINLIRSSLP